MPEPTQKQLWAASAITYKQYSKAYGNGEIGSRAYGNDCRGCRHSLALTVEMDNGWGVCLSPKSKWKGLMMHKSIGCEHHETDTLPKKEKPLTATEAAADLKEKHVVTEVDKAATIDDVTVLKEMPTHDYWMYPKDMLPLDNSRVLAMFEYDHTMVIAEVQFKKPQSPLPWQFASTPMDKVFAWRRPVDPPKTTPTLKEVQAMPTVFTETIGDGV